MRGRSISRYKSRVKQGVNRSTIRLPFDMLGQIALIAACVSAAVAVISLPHNYYEPHGYHKDFSDKYAATYSHGSNGEHGSYESGSHGSYEKENEYGFKYGSSYGHGEDPHSYGYRYNSHYQPHYESHSHRFGIPHDHHAKRRYEKKIFAKIEIKHAWRFDVDMIHNQTFVSLGDITFLLFRYEGDFAAIVRSIELAVKKLCCQRHEKHLEQLAPEKIECKSASVKQLFHSPDEGRAICYGVANILSINSKDGSYMNDTLPKIRKKSLQFLKKKKKKHQASKLLIQGEPVGRKKLRLNEPSPLLLRQKKCVINILNKLFNEKVYNKIYFQFSLITGIDFEELLENIPSENWKDYTATSVTMKNKFDQPILITYSNSEFLWPPLIIMSMKKE
ncbi:hypothetical protein WR25_13038 [Diploscapter pachys]|uniref:Uncharacterized protein n=1 Tax=Diploscapter pachys TaxID=2018661 RepID=A0A2A2JUH2_9BILA|nr:hypothetical protein WR25_13038 [Diploscapter pachys]